tara:strand:- start:2605 stop:2940 length:336 start_codon:yes stop_codon:yes gene_type:complete
MLEERVEKLVLDVKKYWQYIIVGVLTLASISLFILTRKNSSLDKIDKIIDESKNKMIDIKSEKKEIEIKSKIKKEYVEQEKQEKLEELEGVKKTEDRMERLNALVKLYNKM